MEMTQDDKFVIAYYQQELANRDMALAVEKSKTAQLEEFIRSQLPNLVAAQNPPVPVDPADETLDDIL